MKILVLGGTGMLGHKVVQRLAGGPSDVWWTLRQSRDDPALACAPFLQGDHALERVDASRLDRLDALLGELRPDAVVNCVGVIKQRPEVTNAVACITLNALLPHRVAQRLSSWGGRLIQISTDCVFSGLRGNYAETDRPDATDMYGVSKALGEVRAENAVTIRTSMIGRELRHHRSLLDWFLSQEKKRIRGYRRTLWSGVTALHLADLIHLLLHKHADLAGLFHVSSGKISKYDLLLLLRSIYDLDVEIEPDDSARSDLSLDGSRLEGAIGYSCPSWPNLALALVADPTPYPLLVPQPAPI